VTASSSRTELQRASPATCSHQASRRAALQARATSSASSRSARPRS
jgi:hypothetical protein